MIVKCCISFTSNVGSTLYNSYIYQIITDCAHMTNNTQSCVQIQSVENTIQTQSLLVYISRDKKTT